MIRRPPRSTLDRSSAASDVYKRQREEVIQYIYRKYTRERAALAATVISYRPRSAVRDLSLIHISEPTRPY